MYNHDLINLIAAHVTNLYEQYQTPELVYHNLAHTRRVVKRTNEIAAQYSLNEEELFIVTAAAWFHDCGHLFGQAKFHEDRSAVIMRDFLEKEMIGKNLINLIEQCILSTKLPNKPKSFLEKIICDADSYHLGTDEFIQTNKMVKRELELRKQSILLNWNEDSIKLLEHQVYFTTFCKELLDEGIKKNISILKKQIKEDSVGKE